VRASAGQLPVSPELRRKNERKETAVAVNFRELLDADRLRPLWGPGQQPAAADDADAQKRKNSLDGDPAEQAKDAKEEDFEGRDAPLEPMPKENPLELLNKLESMLRMVYTAPLRRVLCEMTNTKVQAHVLQSAVQTGNLPMLIYRLEDSIRGLLRQKTRYLG
jgi:hypothetical protein